MYKETNGVQASLWVIISFVLLAFALKLVLAFLPVYQLIKDIAFMGVLVAFVLVFMKRYVSSYEYTLGEECFIFSTILGNRERSRAEIEYGDIEYFGKATDEKFSEYKVETLKLYADKTEKYAMLVNNPSGKVKIIFAPSEKMTQMIYEKLNTLIKEVE